MKPTTITPMKSEKQGLPEVEVVNPVQAFTAVPMSAVKGEMTNIPLMTAPAVYTTPKPKWSWCHVVLSLLSTLCCAPACGLVGLVYAVLSYADHKSMDYPRAAKKRRHAWGWTIASIVFGVICWLLFIATIVMTVKHMHRQRIDEGFAPRPDYFKDYKKMWGKLEDKDSAIDKFGGDADDFKSTPSLGGDDHDFKTHRPPPSPMFGGGDDHDFRHHGGDHPRHHHEPEDK